MATMIFARTEKKYVLTQEQFHLLKQGLAAHAAPDDYGTAPVTSVYLDTPDFQLIRRSIEKPSYKEKFRVRWYGAPQSQDHPIFLEVKKKFKGKVYKRRVSMTPDEVRMYLTTHEHPRSLAKLDPQARWAAHQILRELDYVFELYGTLEPKLLVTCARTAWAGTDNLGLRVTFDEDMNWRDHDFLVKPGHQGYPLIASNRVLMEVKGNGALPLWFTELLDELELYPQSFSKVGTAYQALVRSEATLQEANHCVGPLSTPQILWPFHAEGTNQWGTKKPTAIDRDLRGNNRYERSTCA